MLSGCVSQCILQGDFQVAGKKFKAQQGESQQGNNRETQD